MESGGVVGAQTSKPCRRCKDLPSTRKIRTEPVCDDCFCKYIVTKTVKRLEVLDKETRTHGGRPSKKRYLVGLSLGASSAALLRIADQILANQAARAREPSFEVHALHVDTTDPTTSSPGSSPAAAALLGQWKARFQHFTFESVPLGSAAALDTIDWAALPAAPPSVEDEHHLRRVLEALLSPTSRADVQRLLVRHILLDRAARGSYDALLLGSSTTALAELTLAETAKGRGFSLPWQTNDGPHPVRRHRHHPLRDGVPDDAPDDAPVAEKDDEAESLVTVYHPVRELFRKELVTYGALVSPPIGDLVLPEAAGGSVASHRDISIEDVMRRYFEDVEENYPSVVANVVRTTVKLGRQEEGAAGLCSLCSTPLDEQGDERWKGEIGDEDEDEQRAAVAGKLCYGCKRTFRG